MLMIDKAEKNEVVHFNWSSQKIVALEEMVRFLAVQQSQTTSSVAVN